ncbi:histidine phosphatase family protein [Psychrobacillus soli]|uniref:Histidine phosphatase family protein n=1 Tax=Psychrobacillus soli TaxID=1543965 RepID=A0A544TMG8_9BACI|nr:histidine phosphatase family protein [Psychrobacillus soli]TQR18638.1 histidine phosphatase family protein [Psychrobacillus soli]
MTNLYFVRHAHSIYSPDELNRPLSERGMEDAKLTTNLLKVLQIDQVISSPYKRAVQTVEGIAELIGKEIELIDDFRERTLSEHPVADFNEAISKVWADFDFSLEGGESNNIAQKRGVEATLQVLDKYEGQNIVIGTHGNIQVLIMNYFDPQYDVHFWEQLAMPDIYKLTFNEKNLVQVRRINIHEVKVSNIGYTIYKSAD